MCAGQVDVEGAGVGSADHVDVHVARASWKDVRRGVRFVRGAQVDDLAYAQGIDDGLVGRRQGQGVGAVEHASAHHPVVGGGVGRGGAGDVAEVVDADQAWGIQRLGGSHGGGEGQANQGGRAE
ncbi:hypothetical protein D9M73_260210 [compost metagenome]